MFGNVCCAAGCISPSEEPIRSEDLKRMTKVYLKCTEKQMHGTTCRTIGQSVIRMGGGSAARSRSRSSSSTAIR